MAATVVIQTRVEISLRDRASEILDNIGLDVTTAVRMFLKAVVREEAIPFKTKIDPFYSEENLRAIDEAVAGYRRGEFVDFNDLKASL